jgi:glycosyltransferase involved in cell wall biosynthesis/CBS domain-containing protein
MKIALIAPPWLPIPPSGYGGIEVVVSQLAEGLVKKGHEVLLFAAGDSNTKARLISTIDKHIGQDWPGYGAVIADAFSEYSYVRAFLEKVDLIHDHTLHYHLGLPIKAVHTLHGPPQYGAEKARSMSALGQPNYFVAISKAQRRLYGEEGINFVGTVYNGIDVNRIPFSNKKRDYLFFIGRASWEKGVDIAARLAIRTGKKLIMAIKMSERHEQEYFRTTVKPFISKGDIQILGDITPREKFHYYKHALATLFTSQWEEPFGLVLIESMACGTPAIAFPRGAAPEIIRHGVTGFLCESEEEMVEAIKQVDQLNPQDCRNHVAEKFSIEQMIKGYEAVYQEVLSGVKRAVLVKDVMTHKVITIGPEATRSELLKLLATHRISGVPVVDESGKLIGIVTDGDVLGKIGERVADIMSRQVVTVSENDTVQRVATILTRNRIKRAPVMRNNQLVGIISREDLVRALAF